jgi:hypothetical protein
MPAFAEALKADAKAGWERGLFAAFVEGDAAGRGARVNEQLTELDALAQRWARVPKVCARIATSSGFLFASIVLLQALAEPDGNTLDRSRAMIFAAIAAVAIGIVGLSFCATVDVRSRRALARRMHDVDRLIGRLDALSAAGQPGS